MTPVETEAEAIANFVSAWDAYFAGASVNGVPATPGSYAAGLAAMQGAMTGLSAPNGGSVAIQAGITAFWSAIAGLATGIWLTAPVVLVPPIVPPPGLGGISAALTSVFTSNTSGSVDLATAANNVAAALHSSGGLGALVPGSVPPAPPAPLPIL